jgi:beta-lactamase regulating signal transducer with metallopeptidase domain
VEVPVRFAEAAPNIIGNDAPAQEAALPAVLTTEEAAPAAGPNLWEVLSGTLTEDMLAALVLSLWFAGFLLAMSLCVLRSREWRRTVLAEAGETSDAVAKLAEAAAKRAGAKKPFHLVSSGAVSAPQLLGLREPVLALPRDFEERYSGEEQEMALLHELTHLRRHDLLLMTGSEFAFSLQWFNPLVRPARKALRADQEAACDEAVRALGVSTKSYAELLVKSARGGRPVPALTLDSHLKERIVRMQKPVEGPLKRALFITISCGAALAAAGFTASSTTSIAFVQKEETARSSRDLTPWERFAAELEGADQPDGAEVRTETLIERIAARQRAEASSTAERSAKAGLSRDRVVTVNGGKGAKVIRVKINDDGDVINKEELAAFAASNDVEIDVRSSRDGEPRFSFETKGKSIRIMRADASREASLDAKRAKLEAERHVLREKRREILRDGEERRSETREFRFRFDDDEEGSVLELEGLESLGGLGELRKLEGLKILGGDPIRLAFKSADGETKIFGFGSEGKAGSSLSFSNETGQGHEQGHVFEHMGSPGIGGWMTIDGGEPSMVLLSNPFSSIEAPTFVPPTPPTPKVSPPEPRRMETEEGTWILIPEAPDMTAFEESMEAFEEQMEAWGEKMEAWGEEMEERGEIIEDLAEDCEDHIEESDEPTILSARLPGSRDRVRALCASGGKDRLRSEEIRRFVEEQNLSDQERRSYLETIDE